MTNQLSTFNNLKNQIFILTGLLLCFVQLAISKETIIIYNEGPCGAYAPCHHIMHEEFFEAGQRDEARQACYDWRASKTDPDILFCGGSATHWEGGWDRWVEPDNSFIFWFGKFYYKPCPEGTTLDPEKGCIPDENDEGNQCPTVGASINTATGNEYHSETLQLGNGLDISLSYNSHIRVDEYGSYDINKLALGWTMSVNMYISPIYTAYNQKYLLAHRGDGRYITFNYDEVLSQWIAENKVKDTLVQTATGWKYQSLSGSIELYTGVTTGGKLTSIEQNNQIRTITYIGKHIDKIHNQYGNFIQFTNSSSGSAYGARYTTITDDNNRQWVLGYANNKLTSITYPDNTVKSFNYTDSNYDYALTEIIDRNGNSFTYQYDAQGRVTYEEFTGGINALSIDYGTGNIRTITNSRGKVSTYTVEKNNGLWQIADITGPGCSNCSNVNTGFVYDPTTNNLLSKTVDGRVTKYDNYDNKGQYGQKIEAFGTTEQRQTNYTYDPRFFKKPLTITEPSVYASSNKITTYSYDDNANILSMTTTGFTPDGTAISNATTYQYNGPYNQISQIDGARTDVTDITTFAYYLDDVSEGDNRGRLKQITNAVGIIMRNNIQYTPTGKILSENKPNGITTNYTYYAGNDRLETISNTDGTKTVTTHMDYLASGEIKTITRNYNSTNASTLTLDYDNARRLVKVTDQQGNYVQYELDTEGNQLSEKTYDPSNNLTKLISQVFDDYDQVDTSTQSGVANNFDYGSDGNLYQQTNGNNVITDYDYDALNRLTKITQDFGTGTLPTSNTTTQFEYDNQDRVTKVTDANNNSTLYDYDDLGNLIKLTSPDTGIAVFSYDDAGNVLSKLDANGNLAGFIYDAINRPVNLGYKEGEDLDVTFNYDQNSNGLNQLTAFADEKTNTVLSYDSFGNLTNKTQTVFNIIKNEDVITSLSYNYDNYNRMQAITYSSGLIVTYHYNNLNQIERISTTINGQNINIANNISYLPMGPLANMNLGNGLYFSSQYDNGYRLNSYQYGTTLTGNYAYDNNHNISTLTRENTNNNGSYAYDNLDRIQSENNLNKSYTYDALGNRTSLSDNTTTQTYNYASDSNRLIKISGEKNRSYDGNGNTLSTNTWNKNFRYNKANRMDAFIVGKKQLRAKYYHNGIGQRVYKHRQYENLKPTHHIFLYNAGGQLLAESIYDNGADLSETREIIWLNNKPIAQVRTIAGVSSIYYVLSDHLNTPRKITNLTGTVLWSWNSDAFGTTLANEDVDGDGADFEFNLRFPGQYFDKESGVHYNYFRDYEPQTGRYLESDPIGLGGGWNTYIYVKNRPIMKYDFVGLYDMPADQDGGWGPCQSGCSMYHPPQPPKTCEQKCDILYPACAGVSIGTTLFAYSRCIIAVGLLKNAGLKLCSVTPIAGYSLFGACNVSIYNKCIKKCECVDQLEN